MASLEGLTPEQRQRVKETERSTMGEGLYDVEFVRKPTAPKIKKGDVIRIEEDDRVYEVSVTNVDPQPSGDRIEGSALVRRLPRGGGEGAADG